MPATRVPSFAPWRSPPQRAGRRRDNPKGHEPVRRNRRTKPFSVMAFKSLHDFNLETFGTEILLTPASVTTGYSFGYFICVNFARVIFRLSCFYAIAADRRTRVQHVFPKPKSSVLMRLAPVSKQRFGNRRDTKNSRSKSKRKCKSALVRI
jgi:hypothetical protein